MQHEQPLCALDPLKEHNNCLSVWSRNPALPLTRIDFQIVKLKRLRHILIVVNQLVAVSSYAAMHRDIFTAICHRENSASQTPQQPSNKSCATLTISLLQKIGQSRGVSKNGSMDETRPRETWSFVARRRLLLKVGIRRQRTKPLLE